MHRRAQRQHKIRDLVRDAAVLRGLHIRRDGGDGRAGAERGHRGAQDMPPQPPHALALAAEIRQKREGEQRIDEAERVVGQHRAGIGRRDLRAVACDHRGEETEEGDGGVAAHERDHLQQAFCRVVQHPRRYGIRPAAGGDREAEEQGKDDQRQHRPPREQRREIVDGEEVDEQRCKRRGIVHRARRGIGPRRQHRGKDTHDDQHDKGREQPGDNKDAERRAEDAPRPAPRARIGDAARERAEHQRHDEAEHHVDEHGAERLKADSPGPGRADGAAEHDAGEHRGKEAVAPIEGMGHKKPSDLPDFCVYLYP